MTQILTARDLDVSLTLGGLLSALLPGSPLRINILQGISLSIGRQETLGLVGESGSGKTTLAKAILGLQPISGGSLSFQGTPLTSPRAFADLRRATAMMFQDPVASLSPRMRVGALLTEPFVIHRVAMPDRGAHAAEMLTQVGLPPGMATRYPHELSGGQARRVCVARALALNPALVIADEPTAGLDVSVQGEILNLMAGLKDRLGLSFLVISHNLSMVRHVTDRIAILYLGRLVETGPTPAVFAQPLHPYTQNLIASEPQPDPRKRRADLAIRGEIPSVLRRPKGCEFHTRCAVAIDRCRHDAPILREIAPHRFVRCHVATPPQS
ncbi:MAG: ABC transporter ATP-binding protein [Paracoccaceae bacterium]